MKTVTRSQREFKGRRDDFLLGESGRALGVSSISARPGRMRGGRESLAISWLRCAE